MLGICKVCRARKDKIPSCGGCKLVTYCSQACQKLDWPIHKLDCLNKRNILCAQRVNAFLESNVDTFTFIIALYYLHRRFQINENVKVRCKVRWMDGQWQITNFQESHHVFNKELCYEICHAATGFVQKVALDADIACKYQCKLMPDHGKFAHNYNQFLRMVNEWLLQ